jgi:protein-arginine kinase activator protein McsA
MKVCPHCELNDATIKMKKLSRGGETEFIICEICYMLFVHHMRAVARQVMEEECTYVATPWKGWLAQKLLVVVEYLLRPPEDPQY